MSVPNFKKFVIAVGGTFPNFRQADLKAIVEDNGATFSPSVTGDCTHLVTTDKDVEKQTTKYKQASALPNCHIVSLSWLTDSDKANKPLPESRYSFKLVDGTSQADQATQQANSDGSASIPMHNTRVTRNRGAVADSVDKSDKKAADDQKNVVGSKLAPPADKKSASKKRGSDADSIQNGSNKKTKDVQKTAAKSLNIPVDEGFIKTGKLSDPKVHIDAAGLIWDATLSQTVSSSNANKFYRVQLLAGANSKFMTWTRWGRVGEHGQSACLGDGSLPDAISWYEKKFRDKSGLKWQNRLDPPKNNKYTFLERNYEEDDEDEAPVKKEKAVKEEKECTPPPDSSLSKGLQNLMSFIFNPNHVLETLAAMAYDANKMPLGKLSDRTLKNGFLVLKEISEVMATPTLAQQRYGQTHHAAIESLSNRYYSLIPHVFGRNRPPTLSTNALIKREVDLLEALTDMDVANEIMKSSKEDSDMNALDRQFQSLGMKEMTELDHQSSEFKELENYLQGSRGKTHGMKYKVINIFRIERQGENDRFNASAYSSIPNSDRRLLWHGSRSTNFGGILSQGLRIAPPEAPVNGYMFGKGVYLADTSSKSAGYCCSSNSGGMGLLLLCDAELGAPMLELNSSDYSAGTVALQAGKIATLGMGSNVPGGWKDAGCLTPSLKGVKMPDAALGNTDDNQRRCLFYNEYIVYDIAQIRQRYLFQVKMN
ncbi:hypothetical protein N7457_006260 [Penicillium paradoxum]|uniref:uncharacterized protein n=1 Tax=Penicillium paradoxum TaxID=176176 RepID=UPI002549541D|nr:uncharacterized protein N7457_006260 [Penicillium paradoxum]KAJ5781100.1 hypothetical protein N7457_006260 [Penicillium paradoxum]